MPTPRAMGAIAGNGKVRDLVDEFMTQKRLDNEAAAKAASRKRGPWLKVITGLAAIAAWVTPIPGAIPKRDASAMTAAGMRMEVFLTAQRVRAYRAEHGSLPFSLSMAGVHNDWITMHAVNDSVFELTAVADSLRVVYTSSEPDSALFGRSARMLRGGL
ncbi:MAG: hypothetical protein U0132_10200 [Gemmatimonadaceae bacterium]